MIIDVSPEGAPPGASAGADAVTRRVSWMLLAAAVDVTLHRAGIRYLVIKGAVADQRGVRPAKRSADLDVLVAPDQWNLALEEFSRWGWTASPTMTGTQIVADHAETLLHESWPIAIDLHRQFPGFTRGVERAFDALWERREPLAVAGATCLAPDRTATLVIEVLNALRSASSSEPRSGDLSQAVGVIDALTPDERASLESFVVRSGAAHALGPILGADLDPPSSVSPEQADLEWDLRLQGGGSLVSQAVAALYVGRGGSRLALAGRLLWPRRSELVAAYGLRDPTRAVVLRLRVSRLARGLAQLPGALARTRRARRR